eukprot:scaffold40234_cov68-Phaeocystis_antarctica.AAC.6
MSRVSRVNIVSGVSRVSKVNGTSTKLRGRLVEQKQARRGEQSACDSDAQPLTARQLHAALPHLLPIPA